MTTFVGQEVRVKAPISAVVDASAVPQAAGRTAPAGSVMFTCAGKNEFGKPCGKLLLIWVAGQPLSPSDAVGRVEIKCRHCKALNRCLLDGRHLA